jgi:hypothetical protein
MYPDDRYWTANPSNVYFKTDDGDNGGNVINFNWIVLGMLAAVFLMNFAGNYYNLPRSSYSYESFNVGPFGFGVGRGGFTPGFYPY